MNEMNHMTASTEKGKMTSYSRPAIPERDVKDIRMYIILEVQNAYRTRP